MTDEERVEEYIKNEVCIKLCPTWKANGEKCDLFPQCHYISSKIKYYRLGLAEGRKDGYEKGLDTFPNTRRENKALKEQKEELEKENEEMKNLIEIQYRENQTLGNNNAKLLNMFGSLKEQFEKMKCCFNCRFWEINALNCNQNESKLTPTYADYLCDKWELRK